jgi:hypothetical protein
MSDPDRDLLLRQVDAAERQVAALERIGTGLLRLAAVAEWWMTPQARPSPTTDPKAGIPTEKKRRWW